MNISQCFKICIIAGVVATIISGISFIISSNNDDQMKDHVKGVVDQFKVEKDSRSEAVSIPGHGDVHVAEEPQVRADDLNDVDVKQQIVEPKKPESNTDKPVLATVQPEVLKRLQEVKTDRLPSVHIFYYPWYDSPEFQNGTWKQWNHEYLPQWDKTDHHVYPTGRHVPPDDIGSWYYPALGPYSSRDPLIIEQHMKWISSAGIDVIAVSWAPDSVLTEHSNSFDALIPLLLNATEQYKMKLVMHLEPYDGRTASSVKQDIVYIIEKYGSHPAFYKTVAKNTTASTIKQMPLFYVYDSYRIDHSKWAEIATVNGTETIRNTPYDSLLIGLHVNSGDKLDILRSGFDGLYTYFASENFSHGSTMSNWPDLSTFCAKNGLLFIPSVGPGYIDTRVRAWNDANTKDRGKGEYYKEHFKMAHTAKADIVSITSFNEWHEGTQIEPAASHGYENFTYLEYKNSEHYLEITLNMVNEYFTPPHENIPMQIARVV